MHRRTVLKAGVAAAAGCFTFGRAALAAGYPSRPITIVVPFPPGGSSDVFARKLAKGMSERMGVSVIVENKGGGGTLIGSQHVARATPDGYTLLWATTPFAINASLYKNLPYDTRKDFTSVVHVAEIPLVVAVPINSDIKTLDDLVKRVRAKDNAVTYGSSGMGGSPHLAASLFLADVGGTAVHVPYQGSAPSVMDLVAGRTTFAFDTLYLIMTQVDAGKLRPLAQTGKVRHPRAPDLPTVAELGYPNYEVTSWFSLSAPKGTPEEAIAALNKAANETMADARFSEDMRAQGATVTGGTPQQGQARLLREIDTWAKAVQISGATVQ